VKRHMVSATGFLLAYASIVGFMLIAVIGDDSELVADSLVLFALAISAIVSAFGFWFMVLAHFFRNEHLEHKVAWGFSLIFLNWIASLIYFVVHMVGKRSVREQ
jgi:hypothetical protein